jgi:hypothetical protein
MASKRKDLATAKSTMPTKIKKLRESVSTEVVIAAIEDKAKKPFAVLKKFDKILTQEDMAIASTQMKVLKELGKEAKAQEDEIIDPIESSINKIKELFKPFANKVKAAEISLKLAIDEFVDRNEKQLAKVKDDFKTGKVKKVSTFTEKTSELQLTNTGAAKIRKITKMFITDTKKIPDKFWVINETAVEAALKNGEMVAGAELRKVNNVAI